MFPSLFVRSWTRSFFIKSLKTNEIWTIFTHVNSVLKLNGYTAQPWLSGRWEAVLASGASVPDLVNEVKFLDQQSCWQWHTVMFNPVSLSCHSVSSRSRSKEWCQPLLYCCRNRVLIHHRIDGSKACLPPQQFTSYSPDYEGATLNIRDSIRLNFKFRPSSEIFTEWVESIFD